jgi:5-(carboxyamino)imidazole ribonucleotide synthase
MKAILAPDYKVGILGAGQLGKMLGLAAANWHLPLHFLDESRTFPAGIVAGSFVEGNFKNYEDVLAFGADKDVLSIEIEHVNTAALELLQAQGVTVHPHPEALDIIKDKGLHKLFTRSISFPVPPSSCLKMSTKYAPLCLKEHGSILLFKSRVRRVMMAKE